MRIIPSDELVELIQLFVTLMIFFSIDAKHRFSKSRRNREYAAKTFFAFLSILWGISHGSLSHYHVGGFFPP